MDVGTSYVSTIDQVLSSPLHDKPSQQLDIAKNTNKPKTSSHNII